MKTRWFGWLLAVGAVLAALAAVPDGVGKIRDSVTGIVAELREARVGAERDELIAEADRLYFETAEGTGAYDLYSRAADLGSAYATATVAKLKDKGWVEAPLDRTEAARLGLDAYAGLRDSDEPRDLYALGWLFRNGVGVPKDPARALQLYEAAAQAGFAPAQHNLAWLYWDADGVPEDEARAVSLWTSAAEAGHMEATLRMGKIRQFGWYGQKDPEAALEYLTRAHDAGSPEAARRLGYLFDSGDLGAPDPETVIAYFREGDARGDAESTFQLAHRMTYGNGMEADPEAAFPLWEKAVAQGHTRSFYHLAQIYFGDVPVDGVVVDREKALTLLEEGARKEDEAEASYVYSMWDLSRRLSSGDGVPADHSRALEIATLCGERGDPNCMNMAGNVFWSGGLGVPEDREAALAWYDRAVQEGHRGAVYNRAGVAFEMLFDDGSPEFVAKTEKWLREAARLAEERGDTDFQAIAHNRLGELYGQDWPGFPADQVKASREFLTSAALSEPSPRAMTNIGWRYWKGIGLEPDPFEAVRWSLKALMAGREVSYLNLLHLHSFDAVPELSLPDLEAIRNAGLLRAEAGANACKLNELGERYEGGRTAPFDIEKANDLYRAAAIRGHVAAGVNFARLNLGTRLQVSQTQEALAYLDRAIADGAVNAYLLKAELLYNGVRVTQDRAEAKSLLFRAEKLGGRLDHEHLIEKGFPATLFADQMQPMSCNADMTELAALDGLLPG